jgi:predicted nucleic acid-binding protein
LSKYIVDVSVAVKWFVPEIHTDAALQLLNDEPELHAPDLFLPEFANVLWKKVKRTELSETDARDILAALTTLPIRFHASGPLISPAFEIARALDRSVYDSVYVALAEFEACEMITADQRLFNALQQSSLRRRVVFVAPQKNA